MKATKKIVPATKGNVFTLDIEKYPNLSKYTENVELDLNFDPIHGNIITMFIQETEDFLVLKDIMDYKSNYVQPYTLSGVLKFGESNNSWSYTMYVDLILNCANISASKSFLQNDKLFWKVTGYITPNNSPK